MRESISLFLHTLFFCATFLGPILIVVSAFGFVAPLTALGLFGGATVVLFVLGVNLPEAGSGEGLPENYGKS